MRAWDERLVGPAQAEFGCSWNEIGPRQTPGSVTTARGQGGSTTACLPRRGSLPEAERGRSKGGSPVPGPAASCERCRHHVWGVLRALAVLMSTDQAERCPSLGWSSSRSRWPSANGKPVRALLG